MLRLKDGETKGTTADTDDVVVDSKDNSLPGTTDSGNSANISCVNTAHVKGDVGELAVVGRAERVDIVHVERIAVHVVASLVRDGRGLVPRLDKSVVIGGETSQTLSVLIEKRSVRDGVDVVRRSNPTIRRDATNGIVGPLGADGAVAGAEEKKLNSM